MKKIILVIGFLTSTFISYGQPALHIVALGENQSQLRFESNTGSEFFDFRVNADGMLRILANGTDEVLRIDDDSKNVSIGGTLNSSRKLNVENTNTGSSYETGMSGRAFGSGTGARNGILGIAGGSSGSLIGVYGQANSTRASSWGVYCFGNFYYTGSFSSTSDGRLKTNTKSLINGLDVVMKLKPKTYQFKQDIEGLALSKGPQIGFVAQDLEKVLPELVSTDLHDLVDETGTPLGERMEIKGINYLGIIPVLTKALQEQQEMIVQLEARIRKLEKEK